MNLKFEPRMRRARLRNLKSVVTLYIAPKRKRVALEFPESARAALSFFQDTAFVLLSHPLKSARALPTDCQMPRSFSSWPGRRPQASLFNTFNGISAPPAASDQAGASSMIIVTPEQDGEWSWANPSLGDGDSHGLNVAALVDSQSTR